ncbi:MAG: ATP-grasp domain-containing protein [Cellulosilyticaceae bacterium]
MKQSIQTLGLIGGNLLASMLCLEAKKRGIKTILLDPELNNITSDIADQQIISTINQSTVERLTLRSDAVIFCTNELPKLEAKFVTDNNIYPSGEGLGLVTNRVEQLVLAQLNKIAVPRFFHERNEEAFVEGLESFEMPFKIYQTFASGNETIKIETQEELDNFINNMNKNTVEWVAEEIEEYERTLSVTAIVSPKKVFLYPIQEEFLNDEKVKHIEMPANINQTQSQRISRSIRKILKDRECEGVYTFKFGIKKNRVLNFISMNTGISVGDIATNHYTDLSVYEQYLNLIDCALLKDGEMMSPCCVTIVKNDNKENVPAFPYHYYLMDKNNALPVSIYVKHINQDKDLNI